MADAKGDRPGRRGTAWLLAAAAVVAAVAGATASVASSNASGAWQVAVRRQLEQADAIRAGLDELYLREAPQALAVTAARFRAEELTAAAARLGEPDRAAVLAEAAKEAALADRLAAGGAPLVTNGHYLTLAGLDTGRRLAELRGSTKVGAPIPPRWQAKGDRDAHRAEALMAATIPVGLAFLLGALSRAFPAGRPRFLAGGAACLATAVASAVAASVAL